MVIFPCCYNNTSRLAVRVVLLYDPEIVTEVGNKVKDVFTVKVALVALAGTVTLGGTPAAAGSLLESKTWAPSAGAGPLSVTVPVEDCTPPITLVGFKVSDERVGSTVRVIVVVFFKLADVPVIATVAVPVVAVLLAVSVNVLVAVAGFGLNDAVTPLGKPDADMLTLPLKPFWEVTVILLVPLVPWVMLRLLGDAERV